MYERVLFYIAKGSAPWASRFWDDNSHIIMVDDAIHGQAKVITDDKVTSMECMFYNCKSLIALNLSTYYTFNVTSMRSTFNSCYGLTTLDVSNFDTSKVKDMAFMFANCSNLKSLELSSFNTSNVDNMQCMFYDCSNLTTIDLSNFDTSKVKGMYAMFCNCSNLTTIKGVIDMKSCHNNCRDMFKWCTKLKGVKIKNPPYDFESKCGLSKSQYTIVDDEFDHKLSFLSTGSAPWYSEIWADKSHVIDVHEFESGAANVIIDDKITNMEHMFYHCSGLTSLDLFTYFNTSKVTNMCGMFNSCFNLTTTLDLSSFNTSKVTNMGWMFYNCQGLTSLDLSNFNTSNVTSMDSMFCDCTSLTTLDISNFDTSNVKDMSSMFNNCYNLTTIKGIIDMKSCKWCNDMFANCSKLKGVKIKNPPTEFNEHWVGLSKSQYTIVDDESDSLKRRNNMFKTTGIEPIDGIDAPINIYKVPGGSSSEVIAIDYIPSSMQTHISIDKATQEFDGEKEETNKEETKSDFNKAVKELSNKLDEIVNKNNTEESSPKKEEVSKETKAKEHKPTNEEKVQKAIDDEEINKEKIYNVLKNFIYESDFIPAFLWFMEHAYNNVSFAHQHKRRVYKIYKEIIKGGNLFGKCIGDISDEQGNCAFFMNGSDRALKDFQYNRQAKAAKLLAKFIIASNTTPYVLDLISYYEDSDMDCYTAIPTAISDIRMVYKSELYVKTLEKVCFGRDF